MVLMEPAALKPHPYNDKIYSHNEEQDRELENLIEKFGMQKAIVVNGSHFIVDGNRRQRAAVRLGLEKVPVEVMHFKDADEEMIYLIMANQGRIKTTEEKIREGKKLAEILERQGGPGRVRDKVGDKIGMSGKSFQKGAAVVDRIDDLKETDPEKAHALAEKLNKSIDAAAKTTDAELEDSMTDEELAAAAEDLVGEDLEEEFAKAQDKRMFFYLRDLRDLLKDMDKTYTRLAALRNAGTPRAVGFMIGNIKDMHTRLSTWLPANLLVCGTCHGTKKVMAPKPDGTSTEVECPDCINGKSGQYRETES